MSPEELKGMLYYAGLDSLVTWRLHKIQFYLLNDREVDSVPASEVAITPRYKFARDTMSKAAYTISELEVRGLRLDLGELSRMKAQTQRLLLLEEATVNNALSMLGEAHINFRSTQQLEKLLYDTLKLPVIKNTKKGKRSTAADVLNQLVDKDQTGLVRALTHIRKLEKLRDSFLDSWLKLAKGDRVYPFINLDGTKTGRLSMSKPNIQQVPDKDKYRKISLAYGLEEGYFNLKKVFIADEGHVLIAADFSQMEPRVLAAYCGSGNLVDTLNTGEGLDIHSLITSQVHDLDYDLIEEARHDKTHPRRTELTLLRKKTKAVTFTITYGGTEHTLHERDGLDMDEGKALFKTFFKRFPGVKKYIDTTHALAKKDLYVDTKFHRRRHFPNLKYTTWGKSLRQAQNSRIQSTASDVCLIAVIDLNERLKKIGGRVLLTVHDSIVGQVPRENLKEGLRLYKQVMLDEPRENYKWLNVPLGIDLEVGHSWGTTTDVQLDEGTWDKDLSEFL